MSSRPSLATGALVSGSLDRELDILELALDGSGYLVGDRFTAADVMVGSVVAMRLHTGELPARPALVAYADRNAACPAFDRAAKINWPPELFAPRGVETAGEPDMPDDVVLFFAFQPLVHAALDAGGAGRSPIVSRRSTSARANRRRPATWRSTRWARCRRRGERGGDHGDDSDLPLPGRPLRLWNVCGRARRSRGAPTCAGWCSRPPSSSQRWPCVTPGCRSPPARSAGAHTTTMVKSLPLRARRQAVPARGALHGARCGAGRVDRLGPVQQDAARGACAGRLCGADSRAAGEARRRAS